MRVKFTDDGCKGLFSTDRTRINRARLEFWATGLVGVIWGFVVKEDALHSHRNSPPRPDRSRLCRSLVCCNSLDAQSLPLDP